MGAATAAAQLVDGQAACRLVQPAAYTAAYQLRALRQPQEDSLGDVFRVGGVADDPPAEMNDPHAVPVHQRGERCLRARGPVILQQLLVAGWRSLRPAATGHGQDVPAPACRA